MGGASATRLLPTFRSRGGALSRVRLLGRLHAGEVDQREARRAFAAVETAAVEPSAHLAYRQGEHGVPSRRALIHLHCRDHPPRIAGLRELDDVVGAGD